MLSSFRSIRCAPLRGVCATRTPSSIAWARSSSRYTARRDTETTLSKSSSPTNAPPARSWLASPLARLMRLDKPIGTWLLFLPGAWAIALAAPTVSSGALLASKFGVGAILLRGAGCTVNDLWDRDIDRRVKRTLERPIASGEISPRSAALFFCVQCLAGLCILVTFDPRTVVLGAVSLVPVVLYPLAKRVTMWPQAVLGLTFNWGALLGWSAATGGALAAPAWWLYAGGWCWTMVYDTLYAHADKKYDMRIRIGSSALALGEARTKPVLTLIALGSCASMVMAALSLSPSYSNGASEEAWRDLCQCTLLLSPSCVHLIGTIWRTDLNDDRSCIRSFTASRNTGILVLTALLLARWLLQMADCDRSGRVDCEGDVQQHRNTEHKAMTERAIDVAAEEVDNQTA